MNIKLKESPEQKELFRAIGSKNKTESINAMEAFAAFIGPVVSEVLLQASTAGMVYKTITFDENDSPSLALDLFYDEGTEFIQTWSQEMPGSLGTSHVEGFKEMKIATYNLTSAVSFNKSYARKARLNVLEKAVQRMVNEMLVKQERNAWVPILSMAANANIAGLQTTFRSNATGIFGLHDLNQMITRQKRLNQSYANGTPSNLQSKGLTNLVVSPEVKEMIRGFCYQPMNTIVGTMTTSGATAVPLPDTIRTEIFRSAGAQSLFGIEIADINELGVNQKYNTLFDTLAGGTAYLQADNSSGSAVFAATSQIACGFDLTRDNFIHALIQGEEGNGVVKPDDQFFSRQEKVGYYLSLDEGRVGVDARATCNIIVT